jgi:hypothetical protein
MFFENRTVCEIIWKNIVEPDGPQINIRRMRFACWITEATDTHSEYVTLIVFPRQQRLGKRVSVMLIARTLPVSSQLSVPTSALCKYLVGGRTVSSPGYGLKEGRHRFQKYGLSFKTLWKGSSTQETGSCSK